MKPSVLWVFSDLPYPPTHGGRVEMWRRLNGFLDTFDVDVEMIVTVAESFKDKLSDYTIRGVVPQYVLRKQSIFSWLHRVPYQVASRQGLSHVPLKKTQYDLLILESEYVADILKNPRLQYKRSILRVHNDEAKYHRDLAQSTSHIVKKILMTWESLKFASYSRDLFQKMDELWFLSFSEWQRLGRFEDLAAKSFYVPMPFNGNREFLFKRTTKKVLFVGSFFMENNRYGIEWFLKNVHPFLMNIPDYTLILVGSTQGRRSDWLRKVEGIPRVLVYKDVKDLTVFYKEAALFINPMFHGAGVKIKTVNAVEYGVPLVSTSVGVDGLPFIENEHYLAANTPVEMHQAIRQLLQAPDLAYALAKAAFESLKKVHVECDQKLKSLLFKT